MHPAAYVKKPLAVQVSFATSAGILRTLEGPVAYERGDALATGVAGERWPIRRDRFERTYSPADAGGAMGLDGRFTRIPVVVQARRVDGACCVGLPEGRGILEAKTGDWIVAAPDGEVWVVDDGIFRESYAPMEQGAG